MYPNAIDFGRKGAPHAVLLDCFSELIDKGGGLNGRNTCFSHPNRELDCHISSPEDVLGRVFGVFGGAQDPLETFWGDAELLGSGIVRQLHEGKSINYIFMTSSQLICVVGYNTV
jgi:hypothetical protein